MNPSVTAVMPTRGRRLWAAQALQCFLSQTYADKSLVIIDDEDSPSFPVPPKYPNVSHVLVKERLSIADKRNMACRLATGEIIMSFDSDDWSAPTRMEKQVALLKESGKSLTGFHSMVFYDAELGSFYFRGIQGYPLGTSQCYRKSFWQNHPFKAPNPQFPNVAEDGDFSRMARDCSEVYSVPDEALMMVARSHGDNTSRREPLNRLHQEWHRWTGEMPAGFRP